MNDAHLHLLTNHLPIIIPIVGILVLLVGLIMKSELLKRAGLGIFVLGALTAIPASFTGEGAEEIVENIQGVDHQYIEIHEEAAEQFTLFSYALGILSLIALLASWKKLVVSRILSVVCLLFALVVMFFAQKAGTSGGEIRHTEIRDGSVQMSPDVGNEHEDHEEYDDD